MFKMITLQANKVNILNINNELTLKTRGIAALKEADVMQAYGDAVFVLAGKAFVKSINIAAKGNPKKFHHVYEWNSVGQLTSRLFILYKQANVGGKLVIKPVFFESKKPVPINPALRQPGRSGRVVSKQSIFKDKAFVMETGKPIIYRTRRSLPITDNGSAKFVAAGTLIRNYRPGGKEVKGSFERFFQEWFATEAQTVINISGINKSISNTAANVLKNKGAGPAQVKSAVIALLRQYSKGEKIV